MWCSTSIMCSLWARMRRKRPGSGEKNDASSALTRIKSGKGVEVLLIVMDRSLLLEASALNARAFAFHQSLHLGERRHRGVARRGHGESAVRYAALEARSE